jgi:lipoprotein-anchoring transpeptidase ErfK/SrfK
MNRAMIYRAGTVIAVAGATLWASSALADPFAFLNRPPMPIATAYAPQSSESSRLEQLYLDQSSGAPQAQETVDVPEHLRRQIVAFSTSEAPGTIIVDTPHTYLYFVLGGGTAIRYGIGVGREGFTWSGVQPISRKSEWPDWIPPVEMLQRQPYLPRWIAGGPGNPLGARAMYLGGSPYRIHGTNDPSSIGKRVSSGCIRMLNEDVIDLYSRADIGTKVVVLPARHGPPLASVDRAQLLSTQ